MMKTFAALAGCALLAGCPNLDATAGDKSAAGSSGSSRSCTPVDGVYRVTYSQISGTCGPQSDELVEYRDGVSVPSGTSSCQGGGEAMVSPCELRRDSTCALSDGTTGSLLAHAHVTGSLTETTDNQRLQGTLDVALLDTSGGTCESTYNVTAVKVR